MEAGADVACAVSAVGAKPTSQLPAKSEELVNWELMMMIEGFTTARQHQRSFAHRAIGNWQDKPNNGKRSYNVSDEHASVTGSITLWSHMTGSEHDLEHRNEAQKEASRNKRWRHLGIMRREDNY